MRTKNKKWTVTILALAPVLALAAFLAVGLMTVNSAHALDVNEDCGFMNADNAAETFTVVKPEDDEGCIVLGDSVTVTVENNDTFVSANADGKVGVSLFVTGSSEYSKVKYTEEVNAAQVQVGKTGVAEHRFTLDASTTAQDEATPGTGTITVTRDMAKDGIVAVFLYNEFAGFTEYRDTKDRRLTLPGVDTTNNTSDTGRANVEADSEATLKIIFLGAPSSTRIDNETFTDTNDNGEQDMDEADAMETNSDGHVDNDDDPDPGSVLTSNLASTWENNPENIRRFGPAADGDAADRKFDSKAPHTIASDTASATVIALLVDENGRPLKDGLKDVDSYVTFSISYAAGSDLKPRVQLESTEEVPVDGADYADGKKLKVANIDLVARAGIAVLELGDWNSGAKPVKVTVGAVYTGPDGSNYDLGEIVLERPPRYRRA